MLAFVFAAATAVIVGDGPLPPEVKSEVHGDVSFPVGTRGARLYVYDGDTNGNDCVGECLTMWYPFLAVSADPGIGDWKPVTRPSRPTQWAYKGRPVYLSVRSLNPSAADPEKVRGWHQLEYDVRAPALVTPPAAKINQRDRAFFLADYRGHTLYTFSRDGRQPACLAECLEIWQPLPAPELVRPVGDWQPVNRPDGIRQWAFRKKLVYTYSDDLVPGDVRGADAGGVWKAVQIPADRRSTRKVADRGDAKQVKGATP
ncbi:hypothetical protein KRR38_08865 [Novosphingobium sp. G106]|uniref:hypothetical protein n=1 Tax=Novosphingobium sp. G106 TaxID=2849500 RepID=UPI001C2DE1A1|nr:hypothetical protein [Novosphingobium sp. G106]MBV1687784.1 hypothetical protein [Novosphingobium sp. G106]